MAINPSEFKKIIKPLTEKLMKEAIGAGTVPLMLDVYNSIYQKTPVDTHKAQENWHVTINAPTSQEYPAGSSKAAIDAQTLIESNPFSKPGVKKVVYTNTALSDPAKDGSQFAYMRALEDGHSDQAPNGVVELALRTAIAKNTGKP